MKDLMEKIREFSRRDFLRTISVGAAALAIPRKSDGFFLKGSRTPNRRPNVVLVMTDDQGYFDLGCHGNQVVQTPNIDEMYSRSTRLTDYHVDPCCTPTRASLLTGHDSARTGIWHTIMGRSLLCEDEVTMADIFSSDGYHTGIFGKWHLGDNYPFRPQDRGFEEVLVHGGGGIGNTPDYWGNDYFDDMYLHNGKPERFSGYCTDVFFEKAKQFIKANKKHPFFCYISTNVPHVPLNVPRKYSDPYEGKVSDNQAKYFGMITNVDENMGKLIRYLKELGLEENTILIFQTDNGTQEGERTGMRGGKGQVFDGGHRVPCFIRWPDGGLERGRDIRQLTAHIDILPTLVDLCGLQNRAGVKFDGVSLTPLFKNLSTNWPDRILIIQNQRVEIPQKWRRCVVLTHRWRLINGEELYDIEADPTQHDDIASKHPEVVQRLRNAYEAWWLDMSTRYSETCHIVIGSDRENPSCLTSHDLHGKVVWNQEQVLRGDHCDGYWAVEVNRDGDYEFELRRWPREIDQPITSVLPGSESTSKTDIPALPHPRLTAAAQVARSKAITATNARIKIADIDMTKPVPSNGTAVTFKFPLKAGKTRLQAWFADGRDDGELFGVYYVYVTRL